MCLLRVLNDFEISETQKLERLKLKKSQAGTKRFI
jgi:hypothetical protein